MAGGRRAPPKCLLDLGGEPLIGRLLRQIRSIDDAADIHAVVGYGAREVVAHLEGCRVIVNPFFDTTGINASLWFARDAFGEPLLVLHGDLVLGDDLAHRLLACPAPSFVGYDSSILDPKEINVAVEGGRVTRFGVNFRPFSGAYTGVIKLEAAAARGFADVLDRRICRGYNEARTYYFFVMRALIDIYGIRFAGFDFAGNRWKEVDYPSDIDAARTVALAGDARP